MSLEIYIKIRKETYKANRPWRNDYIAPKQFYPKGMEKLAEGVGLQVIDEITDYLVGSFGGDEGWNYWLRDQLSRPWKSEKGEIVLTSTMLGILIDKCDKKAEELPIGKLPYQRLKSAFENIAEFLNGVKSTTETEWYAVAEVSQ